MTTKKNYVKPSLEVEMLQKSDLIATSGVTLGLSPVPEEEGFGD